MKTTSNSILKLHPRNYINLPEPIIFFLNERNSEEDTRNIMRLLGKAKTLVITGYQKKDESWAYNLHLGDMSLSMREGADNTGASTYNFSLERSRHENIAKKSLYQRSRFTIIPGSGVHVIHRNVLHTLSGKSENDDWHMTPEIYNDLIDRMETYFISGDDDAGQAGRFKVTRKFEHNVLKPFADYTDKEYQVELKQQADKDSVSYFERTFVRMGSKGPVYNFYSKDMLAEEQENQMLSEGDRVNILSDNSPGPCSGILGGIDSTSGDYVVYAISFFTQFDDTALPARGRLSKMVNDTQTKVRARVRKKLERNQVESKYMYKTFSDFSTAGYEEPEESLTEYLSEKLRAKYPPNQMQLEAIIKGILTKDVLLVLGPPGTGKTSVISQWVEYFIKQGKRVLISSQNNAAVDNVLERFKGKGEIVRLGNENKVQENCKDLLPFNKIKSMNEVFDANCIRAEAALDHDARAIAEHTARLSAYLELLDSYRALHIRSRERLRSIAVRLNDVHTAWGRAAETLQAVEATIEQRAQKQVFLEESARKNFLIRLLRSPYVRQAKKQLQQTDTLLNEQRTAYHDALAAYNNTTASIQAELNLLRQEHLLESMREARNAALDYARAYVDTGLLYLHLESELANQYDCPEFLPDPLDNYHIVLEELAAAERLEASCNKTRAALKDWYAAVNAGRNDIFQNVLLETCQIVGATCIGINSNRDFANVKFDVSIVDESGQIQIHNALIPMSRAPKNLLLGDYKQIPPCANDLVIQACREDDISTELLNKSFFEYLFTQMRQKNIEQLKKVRERLENAEQAESGVLSERMEQPQNEEDESRRLLAPVLDDYVPRREGGYSMDEIQEMIERVTADQKKTVNLNTQFRMPGNISNVISEWFYENNYHSSYDMKQFVPMIPGTDKPIVVISTSDHRDRLEAQPDSKMGYFNAYESDLVAELVEQAILSRPEAEREHFCKNIVDQIGVISAYGAQVRAIREQLRKRCRWLNSTQIQSMVASLDSFQGQERPLIIYSLTRSTLDTNPYKGRVGFMKELRRLNVAFTRSKKQLVILGDIDYLCRCMNTENRKDESGEQIIWPCEASGEKEPREIGNDQIRQCEACDAACERKFARFMRLLMQHVRKGSGNLIQSEAFLRTNNKQ